MDMKDIQGFATPSNQALSMTDEGIPRIVVDPVSTSSELMPPPNEPQNDPVGNSPKIVANKNNSIFETLPEDEFDADAIDEKYFLAAQLRSIGVEPFPNAMQSPDDMMLDAPGNEGQNDDGRGLLDQGVQAAYKGASKGGAELFNSFALLAGAPVELAKNVINMGLDAVGMEPVKNAFGDIDSMRSLVNAYQTAVNDVIPVPDAVVEWASQPYDNEIFAGFVEAGTQFAVGAVPAAKLVKAMTTYNAAARGFIWGAIADFTAMSPDDPILADNITEYLQGLPPEERLPILQSFVEVIAKNETDPEFVKRAKMALEGGAIGTVVEGAIRVAKFIPFNKIVDASKRAGGKMVDAADARIAERDSSVTLGAGVDPTPLFDQILSAAGRLVRKSDGKEIIATKPEIDRLAKTAKSEDQLSQAVEVVENTNARHLETDGWVKPQLMLGGSKPAFTVKKNGTIEPNWAEIPYEFHISRQGLDEAQHQANQTKTMIADVTALVKRAKSGDKQAKQILAEATWYRSMRTRLRKEYGGLGDVFADILGATSANTNVQVNYENALIILKKYTNGDYDEALKAYEERLASGLQVDAKTLTPMHKSKSDPFKLISKDSGALFGMNSPAATRALLDLFREVKQGKAPKTVNFTGNLIGYTNAATVDVWAARYLRRINGDPRIAPVNEKGVGGSHRKDSTMENPDVGGEFGFGQRVFQDAVDDINASGLVSGYDKSLGKLGPDDLQAIIWFEEKALWTKNGWTTKAGEGGSFDYEAGLSGSANPERVKELRSFLSTKFTPPPKRKAETNEEYAIRSKEAEDANIKAKDAAKIELDGLAAEPTRYSGGITMERPDAVPSNVELAQLADEVSAPLKDDPTVMAHQANNSLGEFFDSFANKGKGAVVEERSLNFEVVTREGFDETNVVKGLVEAARKYDQDAVFWSKSVEGGAPNARPGIEVYFTKKQSKEFVKRITAILRARGLDGFTMVTDNRQADRAISQASNNAETAGLTGVRMQYIPEFDPDFDPARAVEIYKEKAKLFGKVMKDLSSMSEISYADRTFYDTKVFKNTDRKGAEWINGGTSYSAHLGKSTPR